jgi:hypothetical protein
MGNGCKAAPVFNQSWKIVIGFLRPPIAVALNECKECRIWSFHSGDYEMPSSAMWRRVDLVTTDVSEQRVASIFRVEKSASS